MYFNLLDAFSRRILGCSSLIFSALYVFITRPNYSYSQQQRGTERFRVTSTANVRFTLRISFKERLSITFTSNAKLHHVTNFPLYLPFTVHYFYR